MGLWQKWTCLVCGWTSSRWWKYCEFCWKRYGWYTAQSAERKPHDD